MSPLSPSRLDVLCIGYACMDILLPFRGLPRHDRKHEIERMVLEGGGPAATAAVALRRLGCQVGLISTLGTDPLGAMALRRLEEEALPVTAILRPRGARTPLSIILSEPETGARTILWNRGDLQKLPAEFVEQHWQPAQVVLVDEIYPEATCQAVELAQRDGTPVVFDAGTASPELEGLIGRVEHLVASQHFASGMTGKSDEREALAELQRRHGKPIVATRGAEGCWIHDGRELRAIPGFAVQAIDGTGAGDAFHAAYAFGLLQGWEMERRCRFANFYASRVCEALGGRAGLLRRAQIGPWLREDL